MKNQKVVVSTKHRGVFFGELIERNGDEVTLANARMCVYWSRETRGFVGLAAKGPQSGCKVTDAAPRMDVLDVTAVLQCSDEAAERWEAAPWA